MSDWIPFQHNLLPPSGALHRTHPPAAVPSTTPRPQVLHPPDTRTAPLPHTTNGSAMPAEQQSHLCHSVPLHLEAIPSPKSPGSTAATGCHNTSWCPLVVLPRSYQTHPRPLMAAGCVGDQEDDCLGFGVHQALERDLPFDSV